MNTVGSDEMLLPAVFSDGTGLLGRHKRKKQCICNPSRFHGFLQAWECVGERSVCSERLEAGFLGTVYASGKRRG